MAFSVVESVCGIEYLDQPQPDSPRHALPSHAMPLPCPGRARAIAAEPRPAMLAASGTAAPILNIVPDEGHKRSVVARGGVKRADLQ